MFLYSKKFFSREPKLHTNFYVVKRHSTCRWCEGPVKTFLNGKDDQVLLRDWNWIMCLCLCLSISLISIRQSHTDIWYNSTLYTRDNKQYMNNKLNTGLLISLHSWRTIPSSQMNSGNNSRHKSRQSARNGGETKTQRQFKPERIKIK